MLSNGAKINYYTKGLEGFVWPIYVNYWKYHWILCGGMEYLFYVGDGVSVHMY